MYIGSRNLVKQFIGLIRGQNDFIYFIPKDTNTELLLYNFNWDVGDTVPNLTWYLPGSNSIGGIVYKIDTSEIKGNHKRIWITNGESKTYIISNVGAINGFIPPEFYFQGGYGNGGFGTQKVCIDGEIFFNTNGLPDKYGCKEYPAHN